MKRLMAVLLFIMMAVATAQSAPSSKLSSAKNTAAPQEDSEGSDEAFDETMRDDAADASAADSAQVQPAGQQEALSGLTVARPVNSQFYVGEGFVAPKDWMADGVIISDKDKKLMISEGDTVFVNLGEDRVAAGTQCLLYRRLDKVRDPETGETIGYEIRLVGRLEITTEVGADASTGKIISSREPIEIGDLVKIVEQCR